MFAPPDIPKSLLESDRFIKLVHVLQPRLSLLTVDSKLKGVAEFSSSSPYAVITFDGWSTYRAESVLGSMISIIKPNFQLQTYFVGNFKVSGTHSAHSISSILSFVLKDRINCLSSDHFVTDSAAVNKDAVPTYMKGSGDTFWFPCAVHFA